MHQSNVKYFFYTLGCTKFLYLHFLFPLCASLSDPLLINQPVQDPLRRSFHDQNMTRGIVLHFVHGELEESEDRWEEHAKTPNLFCLFITTKWLSGVLGVCAHIHTVIFLESRGPIFSLLVWSTGLIEGDLTERAQKVIRIPFVEGAFIRTLTCIPVVLHFALPPLHPLAPEKNTPTYKYPVTLPPGNLYLSHSISNLCKTTAKIAFFPLNTDLPFFFTSACTGCIRKILVIHTFKPAGCRKWSRRAALIDVLPLSKVLMFPCDDFCSFPL